MIRRWFVSYPRIITASFLWLCVALVVICMCVYDPREPSVLLQTTDALKPHWGVYLINSIAALFIHLWGCTGVGYLILASVIGCKLTRWVHTPWYALISGCAMLAMHTLLCAHLGCDLFSHIPPGGWLGATLYSWCATWCPASYLDYGIRGAFAVTAIMTFRVGWIRSVWPYVYRVAQHAQTASSVCLRGLRAIIPYQSDRVFPSVVREHVAREAQYETDEDHIFYDAFWAHHTRRKHESEATYGGIEHASRTASAASSVSQASDTQPTDTIENPDTDICDTHVTHEHGPTADVSRPEPALLTPHDEVADGPDDVAQHQARRLEEKLATFGITGHVTQITCGPVVTLFAYQPDKAVKVAHITAREDDLRLALEAISLRIIAPIPGTSVVGFEVSRPHPQPVMLRRIIEHSTFWDARYALPLALGTDTAGEPFISDLAAMPHVLVAGATGSGKSVALHSFLVSLLYRAHPDAMKLVLIDPKRLEFAAYQAIPHLATPVITQQRAVVNTFEWLVSEMERRYDVLAQAGVRNIDEYHQRYGASHLPYIVVAVDELADLMMGVGKDIEQYIARLAQMARAAGIHLIVATQRPSVDVVTGMIKVNFLSRIAFKVTSKIDSRTIIDQPGAEKLLGRGDMLHLDARGTLHRLHGGFITQSEIDAVIAHWKAQPYHHHYLCNPEEQQSKAGEENDEDPLYADVLAYVQECDTISISLIQRRFRIGYNRSARIVDALERNGVVSAVDANKMRRVLQ